MTTEALDPSVGIVDDRAKLDTTILPSGQQKTYLVLSEAERRKGFTRPLRFSYTHVGKPAPKYTLRELTDEEIKRYNNGQPTEEHFVKYEPYPPGLNKSLGRLWTQADLDSIGKGCGTRTTMGRELAETYSRDFRFYGSTFCCGCREHLPVGEDGEFIWDDGERVGT